MSFTRFRHCPKCGGDLKVEEEAPTCQKCKFKFYQNSKPTASAIFANERGQILLLKRAIKPHFGKWDICGGFLKNGEDPIVGLKREVREELGVEVEVGDFLTAIGDHYGNVEDDFYTLNLFYICKLYDNNFQLDQENSQARWFSRDEVPWDDLAFDNTTLALKTLFTK